MLIFWIIIIWFIMVFNILEIVNFTISMAIYIILNLVIIVNILECTHVYVGIITIHNYKMQLIGIYVRSC